MQIRIANRQDEKKILQFASEIKLEFTGESDTPESVADLSNIEASYFGHDGVFLLAEEEGKIVAIAGAKMIDEDVLAVRRICVAKDWRAKGIARQLIKVIIPIAQRLLYK